MYMPTKDEEQMSLTTEIVREFLDYNPDTGIFTWRARGREWFGSDRDWKRWNARHAGEIAGYVNTLSAGYPRPTIGVLGNKYAASRLAFLAMGEELPEQADHVDRDSTNNRWANLQASNNAENMKNRSMHRNNTSGVTGVTWSKRAGKWQARVRLSGKRHCLGLFDFDDLDLAAMEVMEFRAENGFTTGHGQELSAYQQARP